MFSKAFVIKSIKFCSLTINIGFFFSKLTGFKVKHCYSSAYSWHNSVVIEASTLQLVDLSSILLLSLIFSIHSFPSWPIAQNG